MSLIASAKPSRSAMTRTVLAASLGLAMSSSAMGPAQAQDALKILRGMSDYVAAQKTISVKFDTDIEVMTSDLQKIQFTSSGNLLLARPDKVRAARSGGYSDVELNFDGKTATFYAKNLNAYTQFDVPGSFDQLVDKVRAQSSMEIPGADLLLADSFNALTADVMDAKQIGQGVVDGVDCEHLAFRNADTDWQIWIETGPKPIPRKYVITSKNLAGAPQYTLRVKEWKTDLTLAPDAFAFTSSPEAKKVEAGSLSGVDEVPAGVAPGGKK